LDALQHCFPPNLRQYLNELPETLDETYERILRGINKAQKNDARRLLQCLTVAARPLRVEELAEILAFDFQLPTSGGIPALKEDWRWNNHEEAVLSMCSSLITIVLNRDSRVVQFSHFSVKEYLTSPRLSRSHRDVSQFHIDIEPAHTIMAQACLGTLLQLDERTFNNGAKGLPLVKYAAEYWVVHAQFEKVTSRVRDGIADLFDSSKPHFAAWLRVHDIDEFWDYFSPRLPPGVGSESPLYYAAFCGFYDLVENLIMKHPEQVNTGGGRIVAPLPAALYKRHFHIADVLHRNGAVVDVQGHLWWTPLHLASAFGHMDIMRWLLDHGADSNAPDFGRRTPLHIAAYTMQREAVQVLLEHSNDVNLKSNQHKTPLYEALSGFLYYPEGNVVDIVRQLLEHGADPSIHDRSYSTFLHRASSKGWPEVARLLLSYRAKVDEKDGQSRTPLQVAVTEGHHAVTKLLLEYGAVPHA
jgi:ankyrin repeat protein